MIKHLYRRAFSLVELSIVLVILGLLVGGILAGQSLIHAAELRSVSADYQRHIASIHAFRDRYFSWPGDMNNAVRFWGAQAGGTADGSDSTCAALTTAATGTATCNGDGNGRVDVATFEVWRAWQHLSNAGLVEGTYSGIAGSAGISHAIVGTNIPASRIKGAGWGLFYGGNPNAPFFAGNYGHVFAFGGNSVNENDYTNNPVMRAEDAWNIDTKLDDGYPGTGIVRSWINTNRPSCASSNDASTAQYVYADTTLGCNLIFMVR